MCSLTSSGARNATARRTASVCRPSTARPCCDRTASHGQPHDHERRGIWGFCLEHLIQCLAVAALDLASISLRTQQRFVDSPSSTRLQSALHFHAPPEHAHTPTVSERPRCVFVAGSWQSLVRALPRLKPSPVNGSVRLQLLRPQRLGQAPVDTQHTRTTSTTAGRAPAPTHTPVPTSTLALAPQGTTPPRTPDPHTHPNLRAQESCRPPGAAVPAGGRAWPRGGCCVVCPRYF